MPNRNPGFARVLNLGIIPLILKFAKKYDLNEFIEARIGKLGPHVKISSSNLILAIVANLINSASEPAYATPEFYSNRPTWSYFAVSSDDINRHVIGRLLDKIYEYGVEKFFIELASHVMKKMGISPESIHADSTSFHYHGESYEEEGAVLLTQGYSRDSHPELKQVCSFMVVDGDSELPLAFEPFDGNKSDKRQFPEFIKSYGLTLQHHYNTIKYVVMDSAGCTPQNIQRIKDANLFLVTCMPNISNEAKKCLKASLDNFENIYPDDDDLKGYLHPEPIMVGEYELKALTVWNCRMKDKKAKTINKNAEKQFKDAETKLNKISKQMFESEKQARAAVESIIKKQKFLAIDTITVESHEKWGRGRRKADAKPLKIEYSIKATAKIDQMAIENEIDMAVRHTILSTDVERKWTAAELFEIYHKQSVVERGWRTMKSPKFFTDSIFLKSPHRIEAFLWLMTVALFVLTALTRLVNQAMEAKGLRIPGPSGEFYIDQPTSQRLVQYIHHMNLSVLIGPGYEPTVLNMQPQFMQILEALGEEWVFEYSGQRYLAEKAYSA